MTKKKTIVPSDEVLAADVFAKFGMEPIKNDTEYVDAAIEQNKTLDLLEEATASLKQAQAKRMSLVACEYSRVKEGHYSSLFGAQSVRLHEYKLRRK